MGDRVESKPAAATEDNQPLNICFLKNKWDFCPE